MSEERSVQTMSCFLRELQELTYVLDGDSLKDAVTLMVMKGYSQIPVLHNKIAVPREMSIVGVITWESIGKCMTSGGFSLDTLKVADCMLPRERIRFCRETDAVKDIAEKMADTEFAIVKVVLDALEDVNPKNGSRGRNFFFSRRGAERQRMLRKLQICSFIAVTRTICCFTL